MYIYILITYNKVHKYGYIYRQMMAEIYSKKLTVFISD